VWLRLGRSDGSSEVGRTGVAIDSFEDFAMLYSPFSGNMEIDKIGSN
jgi:methylmalonyl-CoA mutase N-terminal domain/subunit